MYVEKAARLSRIRVGAILEGHNWLIVSYTLSFKFRVSKNVEEYEAFSNGMQLAIGTEVDDFKVLSDLQLVVSQVEGDYKTRDETMKCYLARVRGLKDKFK